MKLPAFKDLKALNEHLFEQAHAVSIYMPCSEGGKIKLEENLQKELKSYLDTVRQHLKDDGTPETEADRILKYGYDQLRSRDLWHHQGNGLALFMSPETCTYFHLPDPVHAHHTIGRKFHLRHLAPALEDQQSSAYLLHLSRQQIQLFQVTPIHIRAYALETEAPKSLQDVLKYYQLDREELHNEAGLPAGAQANTHGADPDRDQEYVYIERYLKRVHDGVHAYLNDTETPVILSGTHDMQHRFRKQNHHLHLLDQGIEGNHDGARPEQFHEKAQSILKAMQQKHKQYYFDEYRNLQGTGKATAQPGEIVSAAYDGRVKVLFADGFTQWPGITRPGQHEVQFHEHNSMAVDDLLDQAAVQTVLNRGLYFEIQDESESLPYQEEGVQANAIFRW